eukprot:TRINITY_DN72256_c0_g1_i1.p1 TRINITY_DN72256_c0_g1~~TRINITY_DN72256_c0_g1_i1.p1  ORF type:complete len:142 (+),score=41.59 TRINITY_DN72256_c0_g1_i1:90-515(+)
MAMVFCCAQQDTTADLETYYANLLNERLHEHFLETFGGVKRERPQPQVPADFVSCMPVEACIPVLLMPDQWAQGPQQMPWVTPGEVPQETQWQSMGSKQEEGDAQQVKRSRRKKKRHSKKLSAGETATEKEDEKDDEQLSQ